MEKKLDLTKPLRTRSGLPVTLISAKGRGTNPVLGYIGSSEAVEEWQTNGYYYGPGYGLSDNDLENVPEIAEVTGYVHRSFLTGDRMVLATKYMDRPTLGFGRMLYEGIPFTLLLEDDKVVGIKK